MPYQTSTASRDDVGSDMENEYNVLKISSFLMQCYFFSIWRHYNGENRKCSKWQNSGGHLWYDNYYIHYEGHRSIQGEH